MPRPTRLLAPEINASSMADIAFLLLIFFLVTTEIVEDKGVLVRLPPWSVDEEIDVAVHPRNLFRVLVNKDNELLVRDEAFRIEDLRAEAKRFIANPTQDPMMALSPQNAIISLKNDRGTSYTTYVAVYNELLAAYRELWDAEARADYGRPFDELTTAQQNAIRDRIPLVLSESEPTEFGQ